MRGKDGTPAAEPGRGQCQALLLDGAQPSGTPAPRSDARAQSAVSSFSPDKQPCKAKSQIPASVRYLTEACSRSASPKT